MAALGTLRKLLDDLRIDAKEASIPAFAVRIDVSKQTAYRVIDFQGEPDYDPSASTVDSWLRCTVGIGLDQAVTLAIAHRRLLLHGKLKADGSELVGEALNAALHTGAAAHAESEYSPRVRELAHTVEAQGKQLEEQREQLAQQREDIEAFKRFAKHLGAATQKRTTRKAPNIEPKDGKGHRPRR